MGRTITLCPKLEKKGNFIYITSSYIPIYIQNSQNIEIVDLYISTSVLITHRSR